LLRMYLASQVTVTLAVERIAIHEASNLLLSARGLAYRKISIALIDRLR